MLKHGVAQEDGQGDGFGWVQLLTGAVGNTLFLTFSALLHSSSHLLNESLCGMKCAQGSAPWCNVRHSTVNTQSVTANKNGCDTRQVSGHTGQGPPLTESQRWNHRRAGHMETRDAEMHTAQALPLR